MKTIFETDRLFVRELSEDDAFLLFLYSQEETMREGIPNQVYANENEAKRTISILADNYADNIDEINFPYSLGVCLKDSGTLIGNVSLSMQPEAFVNDEFEVGFAIGEQYQGNGYGSEAMKGFVNWAKTFLKIPVVYAFVLTNNVASCKAIEKAGFEYVKGGDRKSDSSVSYYKVYKQ